MLSKLVTSSQTGMIHIHLAGVPPEPKCHHDSEAFRSKQWSQMLRRCESGSWIGMPARHLMCVHVNHLIKWLAHPLKFILMKMRSRKSAIPLQPCTNPNPLAASSWIRSTTWCETGCVREGAHWCPRDLVPPYGSHKKKRWHTKKDSGSVTTE